MYDGCMSERPAKENYYLNIAQVVSQRSTCLKVLIGAIIVKEDQIIATGYVGAPRHTRSSLDHGFCLRQKLQIPSGSQYELCRSVHAEQNAIINAARAGVSLLGGDMFLFGENRESRKTIFAFPCFICKKMIINAGLNRVVVSRPLPESYQAFQVSDWAREWLEQDILEDSVRYGRVE
jgi:dCMP deaminase